LPKQILIRGLVTIKQGNKIIVKEALNHWVDNGLKGILSTIISTYAKGAIWYLWGNSWNIYLGSDTSTTTTPGMTSLVAPIGAAPGTAPNSKSITVTTDEANGIFKATFIATWNAGTVSGTVGELALYMKAPARTSFGWDVYPNDYNPSVVMISRLSSADGDFSSFIIDETKPLTVEWTVQFSFV